MKRLPLLYARDTSGKDYWRSLSERAGSPAFQESLLREFPDDASEPPAAFSRRGFLGILGATAALASMTGCRRPEEKILPYAHAPEEIVPGRPLHYATAFAFHGTAFGLLVESHGGRPTKIEGNPRHPESLGATGLYAQASVLDLYDPDRSQHPTEKGAARTWEEAAAFLGQLGTQLKARGGKGLAVIVDGQRSPTLAAALADLQRELPAAKVVRWEPFSRRNAREGARLAFGKPLDSVRDTAKAKVLVALDSDFLHAEGSHVKGARGFAEGRSDARVAPGKMNRLYAVESNFSVTGASADHRLRLQSRQIPAFAFALAAELGKQGLDLGDLTAAAGAKGKLSPEAAKWAASIAKDLLANKGASLVVLGDRQPAAAHAVVHLVNAALGNVGATVSHVAPFDDLADGATALVELAKSFGSAIDTVVVLGGNPVFDAPADAGFARALGAAKLSVHVATHVDETSAASTWHLNRAHFLESWGDVRAEDGTASIVQPLIAPLYDGKTEIEVVRALLGDRHKAYEAVRATWKKSFGVADDEKQWRRALHDGVIAGSALPREAVVASPSAVAAAVKALAAAPTDGFDVVFSADTHAWDGRFANNGWLQELPDPMHKVTWTNVALVSPATARDLGLSEALALELPPKAGEKTDLSKGTDAPAAEHIVVTVGGVQVELPVVVAPGLADKTVHVTVGQGRKVAGKVGTGVGVDVYPLRTSAALDVASGTVAKSATPARIARTQEHFQMEGRPLVREATLAEFVKDPDFAKKLVEAEDQGQMWPAFTYNGHKWGMAIDLNACLGCGVCVVACQAENNIPVVGPEGVLLSREMHWLRLDRYFEGTPDDPRSVTQPVTCQHCENAPCEQVCPVGATVHGVEGTNDMAYNRCIGTKYCGNNCPFKVRRFNYFNYQMDVPETHKMQFNPDVTVRARGVMEKCSFCIQRINEAKIGAHREQRERLRDAEVVTACQQSCPTLAIHFGDLNDASSKVSKVIESPRTYRLLEEINVRPRVHYLAKVRNPNPELETA